MKTILVTGSTDGIGLATAKKLFVSGHRVVVHGRDEKKAKQALGQILTFGGLQADAKTDQIIPVWGDLSEMAQVVQLSEQVKKVAPELDVLINNAGVFMTTRVLSKDGFEMTFCVNHLAVHLLTRRLLDLLKSRPAARVVTVSSQVHSKGHLDFDNLNGEKHFDGYDAYANSKLCNILFTRDLAAFLKNTAVTSNCLHPGVIGTKLLRAGFNIQGDSPEQGAETPSYLAVHTAVGSTTGAYFVNSRLSYASRLGQDDTLAVKLWKKTEEILKPWL